MAMDIVRIPTDRYKATLLCPKCHAWRVQATDDSVNEAGAIARWALYQHETAVHPDPEAAKPS
jgi:hypothetical protein